VLLEKGLDPILGWGELVVDHNHDARTGDVHLAEPQTEVTQLHIIRHLHSLFSQNGQVQFLQERHDLHIGQPYTRVEVKQPQNLALHLENGFLQTLVHLHPAFAVFLGNRTPMCNSFIFLFAFFWIDKESVIESNLVFDDFIDGYIHFFVFASDVEASCNDNVGVDILVGVDEEQHMVLSHGLAH